MSKTTRKMPSFEGVVAGQTATLRLPIGLTYHQVLITYSGATLAQLNELRVVANGQSIMRFVELTNLDVFNQFEGRAAASGIIVLDFDRHNMRTRAGEEVTAIGTGRANAVENPDPTPITTLSIEVDIDGAAISPVLSAKAVQSAPSNLGLIKKVRHFDYNAGGAGDFEISDLPKGDLINKVIFNSSLVTAIKVERDNFTVFDRLNAENEVIQTDGVRVPQTNVAVYDPTELGNSNMSLVTAGVKDLRFILTVSGSGAIPVIVEYMGTLEN